MGEPARGVLVVESNAPAAEVLLDGEPLGTVADGPWTVAAEGRTVRLLPPDRYSWSMSRPDERVVVSAGDTARVRLEFSYAYSLNTNPPDAAVVHLAGDAEDRLGRTPLVLERERPLDGTLVFRKSGFDSTGVTPGRDLWNVHHVRLRPRSRGSPERVFRLPDQNRKWDWLTFVSAGVAVSAGAAAVVYQRKANRLQETSSARLRQRGDRYENRSHTFLAGMQVGVGTFAISLIFR